MFVDPPPLRPPSQVERWLFGLPGFAALCLFFLLLGQHHALWRGEDLRHFLPAWEVAERGAVLPASLTHPDLTPWGPLFAWSAAALGTAAKALGLPFPVGSRLATPFWLALTALATAAVARTLFGRTSGRVAAIATLTPLGWLLFAHNHTSAAATAASHALLLWALTVPVALWHRLSVALLALTALLWSSGAVGALLFLAALPLWWAVPETPPSSHTLFDARPLAPPFVPPAPPPPSSPRWHTALALSGASTALAASLWHFSTDPVLAAWLAATSPLVRFDPNQWLPLITRGPWTLWPLWLVALWPNRFSLWWQTPTHRAMGLTLLLTTLVVLTTFPVAESTPLALTPLFALATAARLPRFGPGTLAAFAWFTLMLTLLLIAAALLLASAQWLSWPPGLARYLSDMAGGPVVADPAWRVALALTAVALWAVIVWRLPRQAVRAVAHWLLSVVLLWALTVLLLFPWIDRARNVEPTLAALAQQPAVAAHRCLTPHPSLGIDVVAALRYYLPAYAANPHCPLILVRLRVSLLDAPLRTEWQRWAVARTLRRDGKRTEWWLAVPQGAPPLQRLETDSPRKE